MKRINILLTLSSLNVVLVTLERFSFTTQIILQPYSYLRLHEVIQMSFIILFTVIIPALLLKEVSNNFETLRTTKGSLLALLFVIGVYFYATGNGLHEVASYLFNTFCDTKQIKTVVCGSMFFNDYYTGNTLYFIGAFMMNLALILLEKLKPVQKFNNKDFTIMGINSVVYALTIFAYAAYDRVLVGLIYSVISMIVIDGIFLLTYKNYRKMPFTTFAAIAYTIGTIASLIVRFR